MKRLYATLLIIASGLSGSAMADTPVQTGETVTRSVDLVFAEQVKVDFQLIPEKNLKAGKYLTNAQVASIKITTTPVSRIGARFTPGTGARLNIGQIELTGKNDPAHKITLYMPPSPGTNFISKANGEWMVTKNKTNLDWFVRIYGDQNIAADTYTLSMDAAAFIS